MYFRQTLAQQPGNQKRTNQQRKHLTQNNKKRLPKCTMMLKFLKNWTLPIAMLVGAVGYPLFITLSFLTPYLIFTMLLLTFCKVSPRDLKPKPLHMWLLLIQIGGALAAYLLLYRFDKIVAEGVINSG